MDRMQRLDTILVESPEHLANGMSEGVKPFKSFHNAETKVIDIDDDKSEVYFQIDLSDSDCSSNASVQFVSPIKASTAISSPLPAKCRKKPARHAQNLNSQSNSLEPIQLPRLSGESKLNDRSAPNCQSDAKQLALNESHIVSRRLPKLDSIFDDKIYKYDKSKQADFAAHFLVLLIEYSGFPKIGVNTPTFRKLKSFLINIETEGHNFSTASHYIEIGAKISKVLRSYLKKQQNPTFFPESNLPRSKILPNYILEAALCLLCVGFRQIRRYVSPMIDNVIKLMVRSRKFENVTSQFIYVFIDIKTQDVISETRINGYQLLIKHLDKFDCDLDILISRGLKDPSIQVRRISMEIVIKLLKSDRINEIDIPNLMDITLQYYINDSGIRNRSDIAKFWLLAIENGVMDSYNFEQMVLLLKNSDCVVPTFNNFVGEYLRRVILTQASGDSLAIIQSSPDLSNLPTARIFSVENFQSLLNYIINLYLHNDRPLKDGIELGIFTANLISFTWQSFPFLLDLNIIVKNIEDLDSLAASSVDIGKDEICIILFSMLKQIIKCLIESNDHFISLKNDAKMSLLTSFSSLSLKGNSNICYALLLESLSKVIEETNFANYSTSEYVEQVASVIYERLIANDFNSSIYIHSLKCLERFNQVEKVQRDLVRFIELHRNKQCKKSMFIMAHVINTLQWKYISNVLVDTCKMNNDECCTSSLALLYSLFESGVYAKVKNELSSSGDLQRLSLIRDWIYKISFQLLANEIPTSGISGDEEESNYANELANKTSDGVVISKLSILVCSVILLTVQLENLIISNDIRPHTLTDEEEAIFFKIFSNVFARKIPMLSVQKSIFPSLITHQLPLDNLERIQYWESEFTDTVETCGSALAKLFSVTLNSSLYSSSLGVLLLYQLCSKDKQLAHCAREFCILLMKTNRNMLYDLLLCIVTYQSNTESAEKISVENQNTKAENVQSTFIKICQIFIEITESKSMPKDIKRFISNAVNYVLVEGAKNAHLILHIIKLFISPSFTASPEWNDLKYSLEKSFFNTPYTNIVSFLTN